MIKAKIFSGQSYATIKTDADTWLDANNITKVQAFESNSVQLRPGVNFYATMFIYDGNAIPSASVYSAGSVTIAVIGNVTLADTITHGGVTVIAAAAEDITAKEFKYDAGNIVTTLASIQDVFNGQTAWATLYTATTDGATTVAVVADGYGQEYNTAFALVIATGGCITKVDLAGGTGGDIKVKTISNDSVTDAQTAINAFFTANNITYVQDVEISIEIDPDQDERVITSIAYKGLKDSDTGAIAALAVHDAATGSHSVLAGTDRELVDTIRSARTNGVIKVTATTDIGADLMGQVDSSGNFELADGLGAVLGVNGTGSVISAAGSGDLTREGVDTVTADPVGFTAGDRLAASPGGVVSLFNAANHSLTSAVANGADEDFTIGQFAGLETAKVYTSVNGDGGDVVTVWGNDGSGNVVSEAVTHNADSTNAVFTTQTFSEIYAVETASPNAQELKVDTAAGLNVATIAAGVAYFHGYVETDVSDDALGHAIETWAAGANTGVVVIVGTDGIGAAQYELSTMAGTTHVRSLLTWNTVTGHFVGADDAATATFSSQVAADIDNAYCGKAIADVAHDATGDILLNC